MVYYEGEGNMGFFSKTLQAAMPKMLGKSYNNSSAAMVSVALSW